MSDEKEKDFNWTTRITLLERIKDQYDQSSWNEFVQTYRQFIYNVTQRMGMNHHDGEELTQAVLLKIWKNIPKFSYNEKNRFRGWLCTVTGNTVKDYFRSKKNQANQNTTQFEENYNDFDDPAIDAMMENEWRSYITNMAWENIKDSFSEKVRDVFLMTADEIPAEDIAAKTGIAKSSVYVYRKRVLEAFSREVIRLNNELG